MKDFINFHSFSGFIQVFDSQEFKMTDPESWSCLLMTISPGLDSQSVEDVVQAVCNDAFRKGWALPSIEEGNQLRFCMIKSFPCRERRSKIKKAGIKSLVAYHEDDCFHRIEFATGEISYCDYLKPSDALVFVHNSIIEYPDSYAPILFPECNWNVLRQYVETSA